MPIHERFASFRVANRARITRETEHPRGSEAAEPQESNSDSSNSTLPPAQRASEASKCSKASSDTLKPSIHAGYPTNPTYPTGLVHASERCRLCDAPLPWPEPAGIVLADGTAECMRCAEHEAWRILSAAERAAISPDALADEAELTIRGELLP
jgi:hypothetical protein